MIRATDRFLAPSRGTMKSIADFFANHPPYRRMDAERATRRIFECCWAMGLDFSLVMSAVAHETRAEDPLRIFASSSWRWHLNIGGLFGDRQPGDGLLTFMIPEDAGEAYVAHLATLILGPKWRQGGLSWIDDRSYWVTDPQTMGTVATLADLFGPTLDECLALGNQILGVKDHRRSRLRAYQDKVTVP